MAFGKSYLSASMIKKRLFIFFLMISGTGLFAQDNLTAIPLGEPEFKPFLTVGAGMSYSVINNRKEVRGKYKPGINTNLTFYTSPWFALSGDYTYFFKHDASPAFEDIHSWNTELNGNLIMGMGQSDFRFKAVFGVSYLNWQATYVGPTLNDQSDYYYGMPLTQEWIAGNLGCGLSKNLGRDFIASFDFRTRMTSEKRDLIGISDTAFMFGFAWHVRNINDAEIKTDDYPNRKTTKGKAGRQYKWLKKRR